MKKKRAKIEVLVKNNNELSSEDLSKKVLEELRVKLSIVQIEDVRKRLGLDKKEGQDLVQKVEFDKKAEFLKFLMKAKTEKEIFEKFGEDGKILLKESYDKYQLFTNRNNYNELLYVLLPTISPVIEIKPKQWHYHLGKSDEGIDQPYILIQLPDFKKRIKIAPLFDVHYGNFAHKHKKFLTYLRWIAETENVYAVLGGDLMENALDDGRGMSYDQIKSPHNQLDDMTIMLAPIAHKILFATTGNHEERTYKKTGIDVMEVLANRLHVPYFAGPIFASIMANGYKWSIYTFHGNTNSRTKGGKMNSANRPKMFTGFINFFLSGHVHDRVCENETCVVEDPINCRLVYMSQWTVIAPSFLGWEKTYAYRAGYPPPAMGGVSLELYDNGDYQAYLT
ncbi:MAG: hypothetical protein WC795_01950 [Candidatus Paceibacterota bacterium]|jgi:hypothetical protein